MTSARRGPGALLLLVPLLSALAPRADAAETKKCLELSARRDPADYVAPGIRVLVSVRNGCGEDAAGAATRFRVTVRSKNGGTAGTQRGRFAGTLKAGETAETVVLVACDPERAGEIEVALD